MKTIFRNFFTTLRRFKLSSALNIFGLSVAFAAFMIIMIQVRYEYSFDGFHPNADRIYTAEAGNATDGQVVIPRAFVQTFGESSPQIEDFTALIPSFGGGKYFTVELNGSRVGFTENIYEVMPSFVDVFQLRMVSGSADAIKEPNKVLLPQSMASKIFKDGEPLGRSIFVDSVKVLTVGGVYEDFPANSQFDNNILLRMEESRGKDEDGSYDWGRGEYQMYVRLAPGADPNTLLAEFNAKFDVGEKLEFIDDAEVEMTPISDLYFTERNYAGEFVIKHGNRTATDLLLAIALLVIVVAAINFVNFSTSLTPLRIKSINVQKILGSTNTTLRAALLAEAVGIAMIAFGVGALLVDLLSYTPFADVLICPIGLAQAGSLVWMTLGVAVLVGLLSGIYPAFYTTKFPPIMVLTGSFATSARGRALRTALIGFQYVVSVALIIGAIFLQLQNDYVQNLDTGINKQSVLIADLGGELRGNKKLENSLRTSPIVADVAYSQVPIASSDLVQGWGRQYRDKQISFDVHVVSYNFASMMGIELIDGEGFTSTDDQKDNVTYMFNETAAKLFDLKVGSIVGDAEVKGIVRDFNYKSLHEDVGALALAVFPVQWGSRLKCIYIKVNGDAAEAIDYVRRTAAEIDPVYPLDVKIYEHTFDDLYSKDHRTARLVTLFSMLAIIISLVGVFGLVVFETQYRRREIGLRKVYGSTVNQVLVMFNRKFIGITLVCFVVAAPLAYIGVSWWLEGFAFRTPIHWWVFALALIIVLMITILTVTTQSYRAATENPVKAIKSE